MARVPPGIRPILLLAAAGLALAGVVLLVAVVLLPPPSADVVPAPQPPRPAREGELAAAAERASEALRARDTAAWTAALPASSEARASVRALYRRLAPLPWTDVRIVAEPVEGMPGRFYLGAVGALGGAAPDDRIMARRMFEAEVRDGRLLLRDDVTPRAIKGQQVMAFARPVVVRRNGLVVIAEESQREGAERLALAGGPARKRLRLLGITSGEAVVVYYYASRGQMLRSLGEDPGEARIRFFSRPPLHLGEEPVWTRDIGVLAPALEGKESWAPRMLAHELTHAYTSRWFAGTRHAPTLLAEGLATAVEGGRSFRPLRDDLASVQPGFLLEEALQAKSLWTHASVARVRLAYLGGASLVLYVLDRWGLHDLKAFVAAVSDSDLTRRGLGAAARRSLGVGWNELRSGWESFVPTLP